MSGKSEIITSMDEIWEKIPSDEARQAWADRAVQAATEDPKIQTMVGLLPYCTGTLTSEEMIERLEGVMRREYDAVPSERYEQVFTTAGDMLIRRELELNEET